MPDPLVLTGAESTCTALQCEREGAGFEERTVGHGLPALEGRVRQEVALGYDGYDSGCIDCEGRRCIFMSP